MRSGKLVATNDDLIKELILDPLYIIQMDWIEGRIVEILKPYGIKREAISQSQLALLGPDKDLLIELLERKLELQTALYCSHGGSLQNVSFISRYR